MEIKRKWGNLKVPDEAVGERRKPVASHSRGQSNRQWVFQGHLKDSEDCLAYDLKIGEQTQWILVRRWTKSCKMQEEGVKLLRF